MYQNKETRQGKTEKTNPQSSSALDGGILRRESNKRLGHTGTTTYPRATSLFRAPRYAFAEATCVSGSASFADTDRPCDDKRTRTSACASDSESFPTMLT